MEALKLNELSIVIDQEMTKTSTGFPFEIFPEEIQQLIINAEETVKFNKEYFSAGILSICATAIGNSTELNNGSYTVKPILWLVIVGRRGTGKTAPLEFSKIPISIKDAKAYELNALALKEYYEQPKDLRGQKPIYKKSITSDFTPEKLAEDLQYNQNGVLIFNDEIMFWINTFDQYKKGGDQQLYLNLWNGSSLTVDRVTKDPIRVEKTNVNILGGIQPEKLKEFARNGRTDDGFIDRFLFIIPERLQPFKFTGLSIQEELKQKYFSLVNNLLELPKVTLQIDKEVIQLYKEWQHKKAVECFNDPTETALQAKLETYVWRFALIIEMMHQASINKYNSTLNKKSLSNAIKLAEYFRKNALTVHDQYLTKNPLVELTAVQIEIYKELPTEFKRNDVLSVFENKGINGGTIQRFLNKEQLFINTRYGYYKKKY